MPEHRSSELRRAILSVRRASGRPRYPAVLKSRTVAFARRRGAEGASQRGIANEIGISVPTLVSWMRGERPGEGFRPVKAAVETLRAGDERGLLSLVTPSGCRVEGLTLGEAAELLRVIE